MTSSAPTHDPSAPRLVTRAWHTLGHSVWLDNITRDLRDSGTLKRYIDVNSGQNPPAPSVGC